MTVKKRRNKVKEFVIIITMSTVCYMPTSYQTAWDWQDISENEKGM